MTPYKLGNDTVIVIEKVAMVGAIFAADARYDMGFWEYTVFMDGGHKITHMNKDRAALEKERAALLLSIEC